MPAAAVAGAGVLVSAYGAIKGGQQADRAYQLQQQGLQQDQAFRQQQLDDYNKTYGPMVKSLTQQASGEQPLNLGPTWAKIQSNFDQAGRNNEASMARKGMLGSGLDRNNMLETGRGMALSDAFSQGLQNKQALMQSLIQSGKQMPGQVGAVMQGNQNMAGFYGQQGRMYAGAAGAGWNGVGSAIGGLGYALGMNRQAPGTPTTNGAQFSTTPGTSTLTQARWADSPIRASVSNPQAQPMTAQDRSMASYMVDPQDASMAQTMFNSSPIQQPDLSLGSVPYGIQAPYGM